MTRNILKRLWLWRITTEWIIPQVLSWILIYRCWVILHNSAYINLNSWIAFHMFNLPQAVIIRLLRIHWRSIRVFASSAVPQTMLRSSYSAVTQRLLVSQQLLCIPTPPFTISRSVIHVTCSAQLLWKRRSHSYPGLTVWVVQCMGLSIFWGKMSEIFCPQRNAILTQG